MNNLLHGCAALMVVALFSIVSVQHGYDNSILPLQEKRHLFFEWLPLLCLTTLANLLFVRNCRLSVLPADLLAGMMLSVLIVYYYLFSAGTSTALMMAAGLGCVYLCLRILFTLDKNLIGWITLTLLVTALLECFFGLSQLYGFTRSNHPLFQMTGSFFNPGPYSNYLAVVFPIALYHGLRGKLQLKQAAGGLNPHPEPIDPSRLIYPVSLAVVFLSLIVLPAARGRIAWLAAGMIALWILIWETACKDRIKTLLSTSKRIFIPCALLCIVLLSSVLWSTYAFKRDSADGRLLIWKIIVSEMIPNQSFTGTGPGRFAGAYGEAQRNYFSHGEPSDTEIQVAGSPEYAFNDYLQVITETGWVGFVLLLTLLLLSLRGLAGSDTGLGYGLGSLMIVMLASYPLNLLPFCLIAVFFVAAAATQEQKEFWMCHRKRIPVLLLIGVVCWSLYGLRWEQKKDDALKEWNFFQLSYKKNDYELVNREYGALYDQLYEEPLFLFEWGHSLNKTGYYCQSNTILRQGLALSCDPMFYNIMGNNYKALGNYTLAESCYRKAWELLPNRLYPLYLLIKLYLDTNQQDRTKELTEYVRRFDPKVSSTATIQMKHEIDSLMINFQVE